LSREGEKILAWLAAQQDSLNKNSMPQEHNPISTRTAAEIAKTLAQPDEENFAGREHTTVAGCTSVQYGGRVRDRIESNVAKRRVEAAPTPVRHEGAKRFDPWAALAQLGISRT